MIFATTARSPTADGIPQELERSAANVLRLVSFQREKRVKSVAGDDHDKVAMTEVLNIGVPITFAAGARLLGHVNFVFVKNLAVGNFRVLVRRY